jgi:hypothetical protein
MQIYIIYHPSIPKLNICTKEFYKIDDIKFQLFKKYGFEFKFLTLNVLPFSGYFK